MPQGCFHMESFAGVKHISTAVNYSSRICHVKIYIASAGRTCMTRALQGKSPVFGNVRMLRTTLTITNVIYRHQAYQSL